MKLIKTWLIIISSLFLIGTIIGYHIYKYDKGKSLKKLKQHIGETFDTSILIDKNNNKVAINFDTECAIVNFWFRGCNPCIKTMEKYHELLSSNPNKFTLISISIDNQQYWRTLFNENSKNEFLSRNNDNWLHYCVSVDSIRSSDLLFQKYGIGQYPSYIVIDKRLKILEVPFDPTWHVKSKYKYYPKYFLFIKEQILGFDKFRMFTIVGIVATSIIFWGIVMLIWIGKKIIRKYRR